MRALVWHGAGDLRLDDVPEPPEPGPGQAVVAVAYCGICGTDVHEYVEGPVMIRPAGHPLTGCAPPLALGHEMSGTVIALGPGPRPDGVGLGSRVAVDPCWRCGECFWCRRGDHHLCRLGGAVGLASPGGLAPFATVPSAGLVALPDGVDLRTAALAEPLAVGLHAVDQGGVEADSRVLVQGFGPIGATVVLAARARGAAEVWVAEPHAERRARAVAFGATATFDPTADDVRREVRARTDHVGVDVAFDCTGVPALLAGLVETTRRGGRTVLVGVGHGVAEIPTNRVVLFERELVGSLGYRHEVAQVVDLLATGALDAGALVTGVVALDRAVDDAFVPLAAGAAEHMKVLVDVGSATATAPDPSEE